MYSLQESLASWATVLGTVLSLIGLIRSRAWLAGVGILLVGVSIAASLYARKKRLLLKSAGINIEGRSIDFLNIANLRRRINRSLVIQDAHHLAEIQGEDLNVTWKYSGYCRAEKETAIEFSIDTESNIPFNTLDCSAYDLVRDPDRKHKIQPLLIGPDGISKKIAVPFLEPLAAQQPFGVLLKCTLPGCMKAGTAYYTSTLSFGKDKDKVRRSAVCLRFFGERPFWVRAYDITVGHARLLKDLRPALETSEFTEYVDLAENREPQSARIYVFRREDDRSR